MAYYIKSKNVFDRDTYISGTDTTAEKDFRWTEDFSKRRIFPTLFQAETVINNDESIVTGINDMTYKTAKWRKAIIVDNDNPIVESEPEPVVESEPVVKSKPIKSWPIGDQ